MTEIHSLPSKKALTALAADMGEAARAVPPLWPLSSSVAVNPFLGQADRGLAETGALLAKTAGIKVTMAGMPSRAGGACPSRRVPAPSTPPGAPATSSPSA